MNQLKILLLVIFIIQGVSACAPTSKIAKDRNNIPYIGTWEYQENNNIFRIFLKEDTKPYKFNRYSIIGHYEMVEVDPGTGQETLIYTSKPQPVPDRYGAMRGSVNTSINIVSGTFREYHAHGLFGSFGITIEPTCSSCPKKIKWEVIRGKGITVHSGTTPAPSNSFEVPTDIILEKVN